MHSQVKTTFQIAGVYTTIILGAGFASGQELLSFFVRHGSKGILGLILSGIVFSFIGYIVLDICGSKKISNFNEFLYVIMGKRMGAFFETLITLSIFILFSTMISAGGATVNQTFGVSFTYGAVFFGLVCYVVLFFDLKGIVEINSFLAPFMVVGGIFIGFYTLFNSTTPAFSTKNVFDNWIISAFLYASYNIITAVSVLATMGKMVENRRIAFWSGMLGGLALTFLGFAIALPMYLHYSDIYSVEVPMLKLTQNFGLLIEYIYLLVILSAAFTTATASGFALLQWLPYKIRQRKFISTTVLVIITIVLAHGGFSNFVGKVYPMFGYLGFFEIVLIIVFWIRLKFTKAPKL